MYNFKIYLYNNKHKMKITIKLYQENSLHNLVLEDFKSLASAVSFLKLFHEFAMRIKKECL